MFRNIFLSFFTLLFLLSGSPTYAFVDTDSKAIERLVERGVIEEKTHFLPKLHCTRGQFVTWVLKNRNEKGSFATVSTYEDVTSENRFFPFIQRAWELGILSEKSHFFPKKAITKIDALAILLRAEGIEIARKDPPLPQKDAPKDAEQNMIMKKGIQMGLVSEDKNGFLRTNARLTRYECAKMIDAISLRRNTTTKRETLQIRIGGSSSGKEAFPKEKIFEGIWDAIENKYLHRDEIDKEKIIETAIKSAVDALGDKHTLYFNKEEVQDFLMNVGEGQQYGIGSQVGLDSKGRVEIVKPLRGSPAEQAGLRPGDVVYKVDGIDVISAGMTLEEVVSLIKGPKGTPVEIIFLRRGKEIPVTLIRAPIQPESLHSFVENGYLVLEIDFFGEKTEKDFVEAIQKFPEAAKKGIILDLRNNPGGFLQTAIELLSHLLPAESVAVQTRSLDSFHREQVHGPADASEMPLVALVNRRSASASEILAGAIQDLNRGVVIGEKTYGKGTAQELIPFSDGSALKLTIAEWLTPNDRNIDGVGIVPNYITEDNEKNPKEMIDFASRIIERRQWKSFEK